jgi:ketosteroid isomerase-like protein
MRFSPRFASFAVIAAAMLTGYQLGGLRTATASAARDDARELIATDRAFDEATAKLGVQGWISYFADDGIMMPAGSDMIVGKEAIRKYVTERFEAPGFTLRWEPIDARVSGDLGYTYGVSKASRTEPDGKRVTSYGKYVTIWRKYRGGIWKVALDIGNNSPQPGAAKPK